MRAQFWVPSANTIFRSFRPGSLRRLTPEAVQAIALGEVLREQLRSQLGPFIDERPHALGILPDFVVLLADHGNDNLLGPARRLRRGSFSFTIHLPGLRSSVHSRIPFPGKK